MKQPIRLTIAALLRDGKTNTHLIGRLTFEDIYGKTQ